MHLDWHMCHTYESGVEKSYVVVFLSASGQHLALRL